MNLKIWVLRIFWVCKAKYLAFGGCVIVVDVVDFGWFVLIGCWFDWLIGVGGCGWIGCVLFFDWVGLFGVIGWL